MCDVERIQNIQKMSAAELQRCIEDWGENPPAQLMEAADRVRQEVYGRKVFFRGLIEFSNYCKNGCYYCGLNAQNKSIHRYRLTPDQVLSCVEQGHKLGFHSFVLQGGEDPHYNNDNARMAELVRRIKQNFPECALTLSVGELTEAMYRQLKQAGADRYLLRHETANAHHYGLLHPPEMTLSTRMDCLHALKRLGYQVGAGFMVGSPGQTSATLAQDLCFLHDFQPEMVGIGPFLPQSQTRFAKENPGSLSLTLTMLAMTRLLLPQAMLPATTAVGTLAKGRGLALRAGANVVMPNLTPPDERKNYLLYDGKIGVDDGVGEGVRRIAEDVSQSGYEPDFSRGDHTSREVTACP